MDPFLLTYQVGKEPLLYDISSGLQPLSIRDQMFRGYMIIQRSLSKGLIREWQIDPVLIVGAGVSGAVAALTAVEKHVKVELVESEVPFVRQIHCRSRFVCPTQYDWPAPHWQAGRYPWAGRQLPLEWNSNSASAVVQAWNSRLRLEQQMSPDLLSLRPQTKFLRHKTVSGEQFVEAHLQTPQGPQLLRCGMIISCAGIGVERHWVPKDNPHYVGYGFWQLDEFEKSDLGLGGKMPNVLISGSGDGALQDFLRITTGYKSAGIIYTKLIKETIEDNDRLKIEREIQIAEDYAQRSSVWSDVGILDHPIQEQLDEDYQKIVAKISNSKLWKKIEKALDGIVRDLNKKIKIKLVYPCNHFSSCYAMNRFLVLLIAQYIREKYKFDPLIKNAKVVGVLGVGTHHCLLNPSLCYGEAHEVYYDEAICETFEAAGADPTSHKVMMDGPYNVVIIRHGIERIDPPLGETPAAAPPRQLIPYFIPW